MTWLEAIILGIVEGITEYLPVSSTGHMILTSYFMGIQEDTFTKLFEIAVQFGAILSVVVLYWRKFFDLSRLNFYVKLFVAVIPALVLGFLFNDAIEDLLESPLTVSGMLIVGGVVLIFIDRAFKNPTVSEEKDITMKTGFVIGLWQCIAMIPGVSRSAASIIGGMQQKLTRSVAAEFSFFLAVPTMAAATGYSLVLKNWDVNGTEMKGYELMTQNSDNLINFGIGTVISFVVAMIAIKTFIAFLQKNGFKWFGIYRIIAGIIMLFVLGLK
ncbi:MAG: undecaprenyl-diphosphate phosphatase [Chitinophagaceae bacterium]|nr:undecaprenyl-diphosphate phosphatase [Chitinophagaceae bacterium]MCB9047375.1 undecaprenyl-diphosphate phosphatase [Chitinophagales bacterium]